ncbi:TolB family protein [Streptomyces sp. NPDC051243]|uniref:TolB family protein n=1 Tax=Streptomyces sp. NPDC051243 TaxID=3365646 RepID=UPI00379F850C
MRLRVLVLVIACVAAAGIGVGVSRWQSDGRPAADTAGDARASRPPERVGYTLTEVTLPDGVGGISTTAALDEDRVLAGTGAGNVYSIDFSKGPTAARELLTTLPGEVRSIEVSADGRSIAVLSRGDEVGKDTLRVMNPSGGAATDFVVDGIQGRGALSPDGRLFVHGSFDLTVLNLVTGKTEVLRRPPPTKDQSLTGYEDWAVTEDGLVRAASEQGVDTWDASDGKRIGGTISCGCDIYRVSLNEPGNLAGIATAGGHAVVLDLTSGRVVAEKTITDGGVINSSAVLGDGQRAVAAAAGVVVWGVKGRRTLWNHTFPDYLASEVHAIPNSESFLINTVEDPAKAPSDQTAFDTKWWLAKPAS